MAGARPAAEVLPEPPEALIGPPDSPGPLYEEQPTSVKRAPPGLAVPEVRVGDAGAPVGPLPPSAPAGRPVFQAQPWEEPSEIGARRLGPGFRLLLAIGGVMAVVGFVVALSVLALRSSSEGGDPSATQPSLPTGPATTPAGAGVPIPQGPAAPDGSPGPTGPAPVAPVPPPAKLVVALAERDRLTVDGASTAVDAARQGIELEPGTHEVRVERAGQPAWTKRITLEPGDRVRVEPIFEPAKARTGRLFINSRPWSRAFVDGRDVGSTPIIDLSVPSGRRAVKLVAADGREQRRTVQISPGRAAKVFVQF